MENGKLLRLSTDRSKGETNTKILKWMTDNQFYNLVKLKPI